MDNKLKTRGKGVNYAKWGYIFILPFFVFYITFTLIPQVMTFYNSLFVNYRDGLTQVGPKFVGFQNYVKLFSPDKNGNVDMLKYFGNTMLLWIMGAVPQIVVALLLAVFFTSYRLNIKGQQFFKTVIYMPNLIIVCRKTLPSAPPAAARSEGSFLIELEARQSALPQEKRCLMRTCQSAQGVSMAG